MTEEANRRTGRVRGNLRPAPFALTPNRVRAIIAGVVEDEVRRQIAALVEVPLLPGKLVDIPRRSEDPRLARANDDQAAPCPLTTESCPADWPDAPLPHEETPSEPALGSRPGDGEESPRRGIPLAAEPARRADLMYRQAKDREARELEQPVDRKAMIREAAARLQARNAPPPRVSTGFREPRAPIAIPPNPAEVRLARLRAAIAFLDRRALFVQVANPDAQVREYRIAGSSHRYYADGVIARAKREGFEG